MAMGRSAVVMTRLRLTFARTTANQTVPRIIGVASSRNPEPRFRRPEHRSRYAERPSRRRQPQFLNAERRFRDPEHSFRHAEKPFRDPKTSSRAPEIWFRSPEWSLQLSENASGDTETPPRVAKAQFLNHLKIRVAGKGLGHSREQAARDCVATEGRQCRLYPVILRCNPFLGRGTLALASREIGSKRSRVGQTRRGT